jgi:hypothetical protein
LASGIPAVEPFAFTLEGLPWYLEQWLGATAYYLLWRIGGSDAVVIAKAIAVGLCFCVLGLASLRAGAHPTFAALAGLLGAASGSFRFRAQPLVFSFLLLACLLWLLEATRARPRMLWWLLPLFAFWPHVHVGYLNGLAVLACYGAAELLQCRDPSYRRHLLQLGVLSGIAVIVSLEAIHPQGAAVVWRVLQIFSSDYFQSTVQELAPMHHVYGWPWPTLLLWLLPLPLWFLRPRTVSLAHVLVALLFVSTGFRVARMIGEASVIMTPVLAVALSAVLPAKRWLWPVTLAVFLLSAALSIRKGYGTRVDWLQSVYPERCYRWIEQADLPQRFYNDMYFGGSFIFHFFPRRKVFVDGRTVYGETFLREVYAPIKHATAPWREIVDGLGLEWFLLTPSRYARLHAALAASGRFVEVYREGACVIYAHPDYLMTRPL